MPHGGRWALSRRPREALRGSLAVGDRGLSAGRAWRREGRGVATAVAHVVRQAQMKAGGGGEEELELTDTRV